MKTTLRNCIATTAVVLQTEENIDHHLQGHVYAPASNMLVRQVLENQQAIMHALVALLKEKR